MEQHCLYICLAISTGILLFFIIIRFERSKTIREALSFGEFINFISDTTENYIETSTTYSPHTNKQLSKFNQIYDLNISDFKTCNHVINLDFPKVTWSGIDKDSISRLHLEIGGYHKPCSTAFSTKIKYSQVALLLTKLTTDTT